MWRHINQISQGEQQKMTNLTLFWTLVSLKVLEQIPVFPNLPWDFGKSHTACRYFSTNLQTKSKDPCKLSKPILKQLLHRVFSWKAGRNNSLAAGATNQTSWQAKVSEQQTSKARELPLTAIWKKLWKKTNNFLFFIFTISCSFLCTMFTLVSPGYVLIFRCCLGHAFQSVYFCSYSIIFSSSLITIFSI